MVDSAGRTALLTGATGGLGRAIAARLASRGAKLVLSSRKVVALAEMGATLPGDGHRAIPADLAEPGAAIALAAEAGEVDVLVANAGLPGTGRMEDFAASEVERARKDWDANSRSFELGEGPVVVRLSTVNGPVQVRTGN